MKIVLACVGSMHDSELAAVLRRYAQRIPYYMPFEIREIPDIRNAKNLSTEMQKAREGEAMLQKILPGDFLMLMDERGKQMSSRQFAEFIDKKASTLARNLVIAIGGPYGFSPEVYARADARLGLSAMTFTHEMARVLTVEQIYRAMTILRGEPYHHD